MEGGGGSFLLYFITLKDPLIKAKSQFLKKLDTGAQGNIQSVQKVRFNTCRTNNSKNIRIIFRFPTNLKLRM